jgi:hypothetical protein
MNPVFEGAKIFHALVRPCGHCNRRRRITPKEITRVTQYNRGPMLQAGMSRVRVSMRWIFFNLLNPSSRTTALGSTQPLTEMSTRNLPGV